MSRAIDNYKKRVGYVSDSLSVKMLSIIVYVKFDGLFNDCFF